MVSPTLRGTATASRLTHYSYLTEVDLERLKRWNMNTFLFAAWLGEIERSETQKGTYDQNRLNLLRANVDTLLANGIKPFIAVRLSYGTGHTHYFDNWVTHDYMLISDEGRERLLAFLRMMCEEFPECGFSAPFFPFHGDDVHTDTYRRGIYYGTTLPAIIDTLKAKGVKPIVVNPIYQGYGKVDGVRLNSGQYAETSWIKPEWLNDPDLMFNVNCHDGNRYNDVVQCGAWSGDMTELAANYEHILKFKRDNPQAHIICTEYGNLKIHGTCDQRPIDPTRLAWHEETAKMFDVLKASWHFWSYTTTPKWDTPQELDGSNSALADLLQEYAAHRFEPEPVCPVAAATSGTMLASYLPVLRVFRDRCLPGELTQQYYSVGKYLAPKIAKIRKKLRRVI